MWPAIIAGAGSILGGLSGLFGSKSSGDAADTQSQGNQAAIDFQKYMFDITQANAAPWIQGGTTAVNALMGGTTYGLPKPDKADFYSGAGTGTGGGVTVNTTTPSYIGGYDAANALNVPIDYSTTTLTGASGQGIGSQGTFDQAGYDAAIADYIASGVTTDGLITAGPGDFEKAPGYDFRLQEGMNALNASASTQGGALGSKALTAGIKYSQDYASNEYQNFLNQYYQSLNPYLTVAGLGQLSAGNQNNNAMNLGSNVGQGMVNQGNAQAGGMINSANAITGGVNSGLNNYLLYNQFQNSAPSGGNWNSLNDPYPN